MDVAVPYMLDRRALGSLFGLSRLLTTRSSAVKRDREILRAIKYFVKSLKVIRNRTVRKLGYSLVGGLA